MLRSSQFVKMFFPLFAAATSNLSWRHLAYVAQAAKPALFAARRRVFVFSRTGQGFASSAGLAACATYVLRNIR
jgi:hypothetical protein